MTDLDNPSAFQEAKSQVAAEQMAISVVKGAVSEVGFRTVARAKARLAAYEKVSGSYSKYIEQEAERLAEGIYAETPYKELGIARLVALWINESEAFFKEAEPLLNQTERSMRRGFLEQSFENLPADMKDRLMAEFVAKKQDLLVWFVTRVQEEMARINAVVVDIEADAS